MQFLNTKERESMKIKLNQEQVRLLKILVTGSIEQNNRCVSTMGLSGLTKRYFEETISQYNGILQQLEGDQGQG